MLGLRLIPTGGAPMADEKPVNLKKNTFVSPPTHVDWADGAAFVYHASGGRTVLTGADADEYARELGRHSARHCTREDEKMAEKKAKEDADAKAAQEAAAGRTFPAARPEGELPMGGEPDPAHPVTRLGRAVAPSVEPTPTDPAPGSQPAPVVGLTPPPPTQKVPAQLVAEGATAAGGVAGQEAKAAGADGAAADADAAADDGPDPDDLTAKTVPDLEKIAKDEGVDMTGLPHAPWKKDYVRRIKLHRNKAGADKEGAGGAGEENP